MRPRTAWAVLLGSAVLEAVWATAMGESEGFSRPLPTLVFAVAAVASFIGLERAVRTLPLATGYAVWTGVGGALTVLWAIATGAQPWSPLTLLFLVGILVAVAGLALTERPHVAPSQPGRPAASDPA